MSTERVLELFDSFWFHSTIFSDKLASPPPPPPPSSPSAMRSSHEGHDGNYEDGLLLLETKLSRAPTLNISSRSDQFSGGLGLSSDPFSTNSVLLVVTPELQTILSRKEVSDFEGEHPMTKSKGETEESLSQNRGNKKTENMRRKMKKERSKSSNSPSELEFEELKGFM